jgi:choline dehydrogenase-like flavoprotein
MSDQTLRLSLLMLFWKAYFTPNAARPNFAVLTSAYVHRIISSSEYGEIIADGVEFTHGNDEKIHTVRATKEVILSAG